MILAVDSATPVAGVALLEESKVIREEFINYGKTHSETLMPIIDDVLRCCEKQLGDLSAIAVTVGPGSFTGLRIGMAAVKGLSLAAHIPVVGISTLDTLAHNISCSEALVCPLLDARKQEVYTALYDVSGVYPQRMSDEMACSPQDLADLAREKAHSLGKNRIILVGDGYYPYQELFHGELGDRLFLPPPHLMLTRASALGSLAIERVKRQSFDDVFSLCPVYVRLSEAEARLGKGENKC